MKLTPLSLREMWAERLEKPKAMTEEEATKRFSEMKAKLAAVQDILGEFDQIDANDLKARGEALKKAIKLQQEVAQEIDEIERS